MERGHSRTGRQRAASGEGRWELTGPRGTERVDIAARLIGDHISFVCEATIAGVGIALRPEFMGARGVADGTLRAVLPRYSGGCTSSPTTAATRRAA